MVQLPDVRQTQSPEGRERRFVLSRQVEHTEEEESSESCGGMWSFEAP